MAVIHSASGTTALRMASRIGLAMFLGAALAVSGLVAQDAPQALSVDQALQGLPVRHIGPALMSGRIAEIAIHPTDRSTWYVAVGSGGVWKTTNAGTTFEHIFSNEGSYSIGTVALDTRNPEVVWVGTGENVSGRHVGFGDGVYRSRDGGKTWEHLGLEQSEHISRILVDPRDSNVVLVAAEGPLWSEGGERGVFRSTDGGASWEATLEISPATGVASLERDPSDPDTLYAATYQRRRTVWSLLAGGPESGIHKSQDGGVTWREVTTGLPEGDMGKIGLAISPFDSDIVYATIEAHPEEAGFYRSGDRGETWEKRSDYLSNGTGPHYYQEIFASPHKPETVYQMDVFIHVTRDGGKSFEMLDGGADKHSDNHALAFVADDPEYLLAGTDAGLYETFDHGESWKFVTSLPVTQIYKVAVDNDFPAYRMVGGTQDNGTIEGPHRTFNQHGIRDQDWTVPYGADGYATAVDPEDPNIVYVSWQMGHPLRWDRRTNELVEIQPQPGPDDPPERYNWDAPIAISPHAPQRLYYGSYRVWKSEDRGDSWEAVSDDLTRGQTRFELPVAGRVRSVDALWGNTAMSWYATLTAIDESPLVEGLLYAGSDDGLVSISGDGGASWTKVSPTGAPERGFINEVKASRHDADTVYVVLDNHKEGDYRPYLYVSRDRGASWSLLSGDLGDRELLWSIEQDHVDPDLLFLGTETGIFVTVDGGTHWHRAQGVPTIAVRDLVIQRRESDLVAGSFGLGFFVWDDYSPLRSWEDPEESRLFPVRKALQFHPALELQNSGKGSKGTDYYTAENPSFGATFTYALPDVPQTAKEARRESEGALEEQGEDVAFPGYEQLTLERSERNAQVLLTVRDAAGQVVRRVAGPATQGVHRVAWDLRYPDFEPIDLSDRGAMPPWWSPPVGPMVLPGTYSVSLELLDDGALTTLAGPESFDVDAIFESSLPGAPPDEALEFQLLTGETYRRATAATAEVARSRSRVAHLREAVLRGVTVSPELLPELETLDRELVALHEALVGDTTRVTLAEPALPGILGRLQTVMEGHWGSRHGPTQTHRRNVEIASTQLEPVLGRLRTIVEQELTEIEAQVETASGSWTPGRRLPE